MNDFVGFGQDMPDMRGLQLMGVSMPTPLGLHGYSNNNMAVFAIISIRYVLMTDR
jgi:hypothetical protein